METLFFAVFGILILTELVKGLSANGTPPILQRFSWQIDLAYFMWQNIRLFRLVLSAALIVMVVQLSPQNISSFVVGVVICGALWGGIYWLFNKFWVGRYKFLPNTQKVFANAKDNQVDLNLPVIGVSLNGETKAYPANMLFYPHVLSDVVGGKPLLATYCGMCRSGRVYDIDWPEGTPEFMLVGAISFNAILRNSITQSWWRQETGEAAKTSAFVYDRKLDGQLLEFVMKDDVITDTQTGSSWSHLGHCTDGKLKGKKLAQLQSYQQFIRAWITFHPDTAFYQF